MLITKKESGFALIVLVPVILLSIILIFGVVTFFYYSTKRNELQKALDISLLNAAQVICSSKECWTKSREVLLESLIANAHSLDLSFIDLSELDDDGFDQTFWRDENTRISLERIRWKNDGTKEILEKAWQEVNPGIPTHLVMYGLKVSIETRLNEAQVFPFDLTIRAKASVAARPLKAPCVAPFAIKACALLNNTGDLDLPNLCTSDKRFGPSSGYCNNGERCGNVSEFDYDFLNDSAFNGIYPDTLFPPLTVKYEAPEDKACFYATPRNQDSVKDQNLIGLPGGSVIPNEALISFIVSNNDGCIQAEIGQVFKPVHDGLEQSGTAEVIWNQIANQSVGGVTDNLHRPIRELTDRDEFNLNRNLFFDESPYDPTGACLLSANRYPSYGVYNSFRSGFGFWPDFISRSKLSPAGETICPWQDEKFNSTFWKATVPVVAERYGAPCKGILGSTEDPIVTTSTELEVVGFARVHIYDVGTGAAIFPTNLTAEAMECSKLKVERFHPRLPFGFRDQTGDLVSSVQVRGKIACDAKIFGGVDQGLPLLIE